MIPNLERALAPEASSSLQRKELFYYSWNPEGRPGPGRGVGQGFLDRQGRSDLVFPQRVVELHRAGHRLDVFGRDFPQLIHVFQDVVQLGLVFPFLLGLEGQPSQQGNVVASLSVIFMGIRSDLETTV